MHPGMHGTTFGGGPLACAVAIEFLRVLDRMLGHIRQTGDYFHARLESLKAKHGCVQEIRGMGLMLGMNLDCPDTAKAVVAQLLDRGILINRTQDTVLRFLPPYIIQRTHVDLVIRALDSALTSTQPKKKTTSKVKPIRRSQSR
jgi:acetylornithine aminotransferase/acetylornithine/N-succinyldiaminopimelate aminotransferase